MIKIQISEFETYCRVQLNLSEHSLRAYRQDLSTFVKFSSQHPENKEVDAEYLIAYQQHLREAIGSSHSTIRRRFVTLRSYYNWLMDRGEINENPFIGLRLELKIPRRLPRPIDRPTLSTLFKTSKHLTEYDLDQEPASGTEHSSEQVTGLITRLLTVTGVRVSEVTNLLVGDVSGAGTRIRIRGKGNRERTVYVTNTRLLADFRFYWESRHHSSGSSAPLFLNARGTRLTAAAFRKRLRMVSKSLMIEPHLTPHQFRHSAATMLIEEGVDIRLVQRLLGHASISTTEIYTKVSDNSLVAAIERADTLSQVDS